MRGESDGVSIASDGTLRLAPRVDVLVEPDPDRGADIVIARGSPLLNIGYIRGITAAGRIWPDEHVREDVPVVSGSIVAGAIIAERLIDGARRDGLVVQEEDDS